MQQTKSYWLLVAAAGVVGAFVASACVVTTSTDVPADGGSGGSSAGTSSGGTATAGGTAGTGTSAGGSSGSTGIAGTSAGGTGGTAQGVGCDMGEAGAMTGTPATTCAAASSDACGTCIATKPECCTALEVCNGTNPNNQCKFGGPSSEGEFACIRVCMKKAFADNGGVELPEDLGTCANNCTTPSCPGSVIGVSTSILIGCAHADGACIAECFQ